MKVDLSNEQINGLKSGIQDMMQGLLTLNKVLTMVRVPESAKCPDVRPQLHDSHVEAFKRHHGIEEAHVQAFQRAQKADVTCSEPYSSFRKRPGSRGMIV